MGGETRTPLSSSYPVLVKKPVGKQIESIYTGRLRQFTEGGEDLQRGSEDNADISWRPV